jgi:hypothetical protein
MLLDDWADQWWDEERGLLWNPPGSFDEHGMAPMSMHMVPQSAWYAVGCAMRGDVARAQRIVDELRQLQYDAPGAVWDGTFARFAEWRTPPLEGAVEWIDYDPNWRQFIGTTFWLLRHHWDIEIGDAIERAIAGEPVDRVSPRYSNIALMKAWLERDETYAARVVEVFDAHGAFEEYGSPTYYGIDLFALALWTEHPPSPFFAEHGERVTEALWTDIARWWHPRLENLCGPYSRAYGLDMRSHVALLGLWFPAPVLPPLDAAVIDHSHDLTMAPLVDLLGRRAAPDARVEQLGVVRQQITQHRVATGWLGGDAMCGGETGGRWPAEGQYTPATAHWAGGHLAVRSPAPVSAAVEEPGVLRVSGSALRVEHGGTAPCPGEISATDEEVVVRFDPGEISEHAGA